MATVSNRLTRFLEEQNISFEVIQHRRDYTAQEAAAHTHTPGREFAKTVILVVDGNFVVVALPAPAKVNFGKLKEVLGARDVRLASEPEMERICPDCEAGAVPPFGNLYKLPVYVSPSLAADERITFNAGCHETAIRIPYRDFERLVHPKVLDVAL